MKKRNRFLSLLLSLVLILQLVGCSLISVEKSNNPDTVAKATEEYQYYDKSDAESIRIQNEFDEFTNSIFCDLAKSSSLYLNFLLKNPESYQITDTDSLLGEYSLIQMQENAIQNEELQNQLREIPYSRLTTEQQFLYNVLSDYLTIESSCSGLELYYQPLSETIGIQAQLPVLLSEYTFSDKQDIETYLSLLRAVPSLFDEIMTFERQKAEAGLAPNNTSIDRIIESCEAATSSPAGNPLTETFEQRLEQVEGLSEEEKEAYQEQNTQAITDSVIPAYKTLIQNLETLRNTGKNEGGLCGYADGRRYYEYMVLSNSGTSYTMEELYKQIQIQLDSDLRTISSLVSEHPELTEQINTYKFSVSEPSDILANLKTGMSADFPTPKNGFGTLTLKYVPKALEASLSPAFFLIPPLDDCQNTVIYINNMSVKKSHSLYNTLAHEGLPGHLYQTLYFLQKDPNPLLRLLSCSGYSEGWATYAEYYAYTFDNGLDENLQQLLMYNSSAILGLYALLDFNVNYNKWTQKEVADYLKSRYGITDTEIADDIFYTMIDCPTNYLQYYVGYLEILNLRKEAKEALGDAFDIKEFHTFILDMAPASFRVIRQYFSSWLLSQQV